MSSDRAAVAKAETCMLQEELWFRHSCKATGGALAHRFCLVHHCILVPAPMTLVSPPSQVSMTCRGTLWQRVGGMGDPSLIPWCAVAHMWPVVRGGHQGRTLTVSPGVKRGAPERCVAAFFCNQTCNI
jgi:hypothetical protein